LCAQLTRDLFAIAKFLLKKAYATKRFLVGPCLGEVNVYSPAECPILPRDLATVSLFDVFKEITNRPACKTPDYD